MREIGAVFAVLAAMALCATGAGAAQTVAPGATAPPQAAGQPAPALRNSSSEFVIRYDHWTDEDERGFGEFISAIGNSGCRTVNSCLHDPANPFRASDPSSMPFPLGLRRSALCAARLLCLEAGPALFL